MKTFLKIDYYLQLIVLVGYLIVSFVYSLVEDKFFYMWMLFYFIVGGFQLFSYIIKLFIGFWSDLFMKIYGIMILPIWFAFLLNSFNINIDLISLLPFYGLFISPFFAIAYIFYCRDKSNDYKMKL